MSTFEKIYEVVRNIPKGKVATYGQVALLAGNPRWARVVGYALHVNLLLHLAVQEYKGDSLNPRALFLSPTVQLI